MNRHLTSAERAVIARITDLAIDVTARGRHIVNVNYLGKANTITIVVEKRRSVARENVHTIAAAFSLPIVLPDTLESAEMIQQRTHTLADAAKFLESLLDTPEAPTC